MGASSDAKVTVMILNVDLDCCQCYRKVKKLLCKFPQIRDQVYDEKQNTVTITVICCSPEKIKEKLCSKGGKSIKSIAIKESKKSDPEKPKDKSEEKHKQQAAAELEKPKSKSADEQKPPTPEKRKKSVSWSEPVDGKKSDSSKKESSDAPKAKAAADPPPKSAAPAPAPAKLLEPEAQWVPGYPPVSPPQVFPVTVYYGGGSYYQGVPAAGPFYQGYPYAHQPCPPGPGYYGISRSDYFTDENPTACSIM